MVGATGFSARDVLLQEPCSTNKHTRHACTRESAAVPGTRTRTHARARKHTHPRPTGKYTRTRALAATASMSAPSAYSVEARGSGFEFTPFGVSASEMARKRCTHAKLGSYPCACAVAVRVNMQVYDPSFGADRMPRSRGRAHPADDERIPQQRLCCRLPRQERSAQAWPTPAGRAMPLPSRAATTGTEGRDGRRLFGAPRRRG
jgi:hypothetical protein